MSNTIDSGNEKAWADEYAEIVALGVEPDDLAAVECRRVEAAAAIKGHARASLVDPRPKLQSLDERAVGSMVEDLGLAVLVRVGFRY